MNITNNSVPSVSIRWRQKEILGCVVYSHCPTNDSCSKCKHRCCLTCNYVTKPFGILKRVIKSEKVCISIGQSNCRYLFSHKSLWQNSQTCFKIFRSIEKVIL